MYSTGLPILYPFGCIFYMVLYWVYKGLLLKYYARTTKFNQEIPIESMTWFKVALFFHLFIGSIMLSNQSFFPPQEADEDSQATKLGEKAVDYLGNLHIPYADNFIGGYFVRLTAGSQSTIYFTFIVILIALIVAVNVLDILFNLFEAILAPIFKCLCKCCKCCKKKHKVKSKDFYKELSVLPLEQILRKAKDDKDDFYANVFKNDDYSKKLAEKCGQYRFPEETELGGILNNLGAGYFERR